MHSNISDNEIVPAGYSVYRRDRINKRGGGILIAVSNHVRSQLIHTHVNVEAISIELSLSPKNRYLPCIYVPPNSDNDYYRSLLDHVNSQCLENSDVLVVGDFNAPDINWSTLNPQTHFSRCLCLCL